MEYTSIKIMPIIRPNPTLRSVTGIMNAENTPPSEGFVFTNNIVNFGTYGFAGTGTAGGISTLDAWFANYTFVRNAILRIGEDGTNPSKYPNGNFFPIDISEVGFANSAGGDYRLVSSSRYRNAGTDGKDLGANIDFVTAMTSGTSRIAPKAPRAPAIIR